MSGTSIGDATSLAGASLQSTDVIPVERPGVTTPYKTTLSSLPSIVTKIVDPAAHGAIGDGVADDLTALQAAFTEAATYHGAVNLSNDTYVISGELDASGVTILSNGATIKRTDGAGYVMAVAGTVGTYSNIDSNAAAAQNIIVDAGLAASLETGDLIKITSSADFNAAEGIAQGEMAIVDYVTGSNIYLKTPLWDSYTTANTAKIALVTPAVFNISGELTLQNTQTAATDTTSGLHLQHTIGTKIDNLIVKDTSYIGVRVASCYAPVINAYVHGSLYTSTALSYGLAIHNATMYGTFTGTYIGHRHAVTGGGSSAEDGVGWGNKVTASGSNTDNFTVFDSHASVGDIEYVGCTAHCGTFPEGVTIGFGLAAKHSKVTDCRVIGAHSAVRVRPDVTIADLVIRGLRIEDCSLGVYINYATATITNLIIDGITGNLISDDGTYAVSILDATITNWFIDNVRIKNGGIFNIAAAVVPPALLEINNSYCDGTGTPVGGSTTWDGVRSLNATVTYIRLNNTTIKNKGLGVYSSVALAALELNNCVFDGNWFHNKILDCDYVYIRGGSYLGHLHADADSGIVNYTNTANADVLMVDGVITNEVHILGAGGGATTALVGVIDFRSAPTDITKQNAAARIDVYSGGPGWLKVLSGNGTPESAVTATIGSLFLRKDGGANTTLYIQDSGAGNTGWAAM